MAAENGSVCREGGQRFTVSATKLATIKVEKIPDLQVEKPASNRLSYDMRIFSPLNDAAPLNELFI